MGEYANEPLDKNVQRRICDNNGESPQGQSKKLKPGYLAWLPADVRYDDQISANAKLLYAEISALAEKSGYCWADNEYFATLYRITERSIRRMLDALSNAGYIRIEEERGDHNSLLQRRIYCGLNPSEPLDKKVRPLDKKVQTHFIKEQKILTSVRGTRKKTPPRPAPDWKPERFNAFWDYYRQIPGEGGKRRNENKQAAMNAWDALQPTDECITHIARMLLRQMATAEWKRGVGIPMAATYLNNRRWEDAEDLPNPPRTNDNSPRDASQEAMVGIGRDVRWM